MTNLAENRNHLCLPPFKSGQQAIYASSILQTSGSLMYVREGMSIREIVESVLEDRFKRVPHKTYVWIQGELIPERLWDSIYPKTVLDNQGNLTPNLYIKIVPMGGGGGGGKKNPLRTILSLAVIVASFYLGPALGAALLPGATAATQAAVGGFIISAVGNLLVNAIAPPPKPRISSGNSYNDTRDSPTLFIEGARNDVRKFSPIPVVLGKHRMVPPLAALNYTESFDDKQYVRQLFTWGYGEIVLTEEKIGETLLTAFQNVETEHVLDGSSATANLALYPGDVFEDSLNIQLLATEGWQLRTSQINADELIVDITAPRGMVSYDANGNRATRTVQMEVEYSVANQNNWIAVSDPNLTFNDATTAAVRRSIKIDVPNGQYDVRVKRVTADTDSDQTFDETWWTALRTVTHENPVSFPGINLTALRMQATDQLSGVVDQYNGVPSQVIPDWDNTLQTWIKRETSNPASISLFVARNNPDLNSGGGANDQPLGDNRIDFDSLQAWHAYCLAEGFEYNAVIDFRSSVRSQLEEIAAAGRASLTLKDGKWSWVVDKPQTTIAQHFTPRNTANVKVRKTFVDVPHGLRCIFLNEEIGYLQDERIVYDDGYDESNAEIIEAIDFPGITKPSLIWKHGRQAIAQMKLRPREISFSMDPEFLNAPRGSRCKLSYDVLNVGLGSGRIKSLTVTEAEFAPGEFDPDEFATEQAITAIAIDEEVYMNGTDQYCVRIRMSDGTSVIKDVVTEMGYTKTLTFVEPESFNSDFALGEFDQTEFSSGSTSLAIDDLVMFGLKDLETIDVIVKDIIPEGDLVATIVVQDYSPGIFTASEGTIPTFNSGSTVPPELLQPNAPQLVSVQSDEEVQIRNPDGSISSRMVFTLNNTNVGDVTPLISQRLAGTDTFVPSNIVSATPEKIVLEGFDIGKRYDFEIRYKRVGSVAGLLSNIISFPLTESNRKFIGTSAPPPDVEQFKVQILDTTAILTWDQVEVLDFSHYRIKFTPATFGATWNSAQLLKDNIKSVQYITPLQGGTYLIKAVDTSGNESTNATLIINTISQTGFNSVITVTEDPTFSGTHNNTTVDTGALILDDRSLLTGTYTFNSTPDLEDIYVCRLSAIINAVGEDVTNVMSSWTSLAALASLSGTDPSAWDAILYIRTTEDDPSGTPTWTDWEVFVPGDYKLRAAQFRLELNTTLEAVTPVISDLSVLIDMPDRVIHLQDESISASGSTITPSPAFKQLLDVQVTGQDLSTGDYVVVDKVTYAPSVFVQFFDNTDTGIARTADIQLTGYGSVQT